MAIKVTLFFLSIFFFIGFLSFSIFSYRKAFKLKYSFKAMFPFEFNYKKDQINNSLGNLFLLIFVGTTLTFLIMCNQNRSDGYEIFNVVSGVILLLLIIALVFIGFNDLRKHMAVSVLFLALNFAYTGCIAIRALLNYQNDGSTLDVTIFVISLIQVVIELVFFANPALMKPFSGEKVIDQSGKEIIKRPNKIALAFTEWMFIFFFIISNLLMLIISM